MKKPESGPAVASVGTVKPTVREQLMMRTQSEKVTAAKAVGKYQHIVPYDGDLMEEFTTLMGAIPEDTDIPDFVEESIRSLVQSLKNWQEMRRLGAV